MEAQTELQTYMERGKQALAQGKAREAAIAYAHGAQIEATDPQVHLGLAEANLALGNYGVVQMACHRVQELQPSGGNESRMAQALLDLLDHHYDRALQSVDAVVADDPSSGYVHALRAYLLRTQGQDYDANLARARSVRLSYGGHFDNVFPPLETAPKPGYSTNPYQQQQPSTNRETNQTSQRQNPYANREQNAGWSRPNGFQRQVIRSRFAMSRSIGLMTNVLIAVNVIIFVLSLLFPQIMAFGMQDNNQVLQGQYWRIFTAMFLHESIIHVGVNMLSLFFIGRAVEIFYGQWRYLVIYLVSGIIGGIAFLFLSPGQSAVGASGAIFGVFGALGVFYIVNWRALGSSATGAVSNWLFWLAINIVYGIMPGTNIAIWAHVGGLVGGMIISYLLIPRSRRGNMFV
ncbi:MAG TPA: rhomboid family intramembrane serine protease [Dictyobacter sp.]|nr:rhomboid family intramembrane serine protease [Dictyobacter sp.]